MSVKRLFVYPYLGITKQKQVGFLTLESTYKKCLREE